MCEHIDKLNRNFLWGCFEGARKIHLVNWNQVCKNKKHGGLGIRKAREQNSTFISKLGWKLISNAEDLWCKVLKSKYLRKHSISSWPTKRRASHTWKSIIKNRDVLDKNIKRNVGTGEDISLWTDWWCGSQPLCNKYQGPHIDNRAKVSSILDDEGK